MHKHFITIQINVQSKPELKITTIYVANTYLYLEIDFLVASKICMRRKVVYKIAIG